MRSRDQTLRQDVVARRLALLRAELSRDSRQAGDLPELTDGPPATAAFTAPAGATTAPAAPHVPDLPDRGPVRASGLRAVLADLVPESLRGRVSLEPWQLVVVTLVVGVGLLLTCVHVVRSGASAAAAPPPAPAVPAATMSASVSPAPLVSLGSAPSASASQVVIDVEGAVHRPGVKRLPEGSRVLDALRAAGGATKRSRLDGLNLAAVLTDGEQIRVGAPGGGLSDAGVTGDGTSGTGTVDLNTADETQLDSLPGVGPVTAQSILQWRQKNGRFTSVNELLEISGIGPATLAKIAPHATV